MKKIWRTCCIGKLAWRPLKDLWSSCGPPTRDKPQRLEAIWIQEAGAAEQQGGQVTIEGCGSLQLSISDLRDLMDSPPGTARWMQYSQNGEHRMTVVVEVRASHGYVHLRRPSRAWDCARHRIFAWA